MRRRGFISSLAGVVGWLAIPFKALPAASASRPPCEPRLFLDRECTVPGYFHQGKIYVSDGGAYREVSSIVLPSGQRFEAFA